MPETDGAEQATAGAVLLAADPIRAEILSIVQDDDILDPRVRFVVSTVRAMVEAGVPVDEITVADYIRTNGMLDVPRLSLGVYLHDLTVAAPIAVTGPWYARAVVENAARRGVTAAAVELARVAEKGSLADLQQITTVQLVTLLEALARAVSVRG